MKKFQRLSLCALFALCSLCASAYDFSAKNDDGVTIYYTITTSGVCVTYKNVDYSGMNPSYKTDYEGTVVIPETVTYDGNTYSVTAIGAHAFNYCYELEEVTIPNSVITISDYAFYKCIGLTEITIPNSVTSIGMEAFRDCNLISVTLGNSVATIGSLAFAGCKKLTEITIPESVTSLQSQNSSTNYGWNGAFYNCTSLTKVNFNAIACKSVAFGDNYVTRAFCGCNISKFNFGDKVTIIPAYLCYGCSLTELTIPESVTEIGNYALCVGSDLREITIPSNVSTIGDGAFYNCSGLTEVNFNATSCTSAGSSDNPIFEGCKNLMTAYIGDNVINIPSYLFYNCTELAEISIPESVTSIGNDAFGNCSGLWSISNTGKTQATCTMKLINSNISGAESGIVCDNTFYSVDDDGCHTFTNLVPDNSYSYYLGVKLSNGSFSRHGDSNDVTTATINAKIKQIDLTPDTYIATGSYTQGDAVVTETGFTGYMTDGVTLYLSNLEPETEYTVEYYVKVSGGKVTTSTTFTTPAVEFTTLPAKATSNTVARIGATTNLSDDAMGAGFEWRRNDAPSTMPSSQAECPVIDGELSGTLNGLNPDTYYDFRPYYTSEGGVSYYGDWVTLLTADAYVYFEPTVRTYEPTSVSSESATVKAYVVAGSDDITSQGFEYWQGDSSSAMQVKRASTTDENGVTRVEVSGQWMTAIFEDLEPSTTYSYRAYATTAVDTTYGETISFTTDVPTGIETMTAGETEVYEVARYTMDGIKILHPVRGINILRYSDGTTKKVLVK